MLQPPPPPTASRRRFKDQYWVKTIKWYLYKRLLGQADWNTKYMFDRHVRRLGAGDVAIDCGANVGVFTEPLARSGALVHAFEPCPYAFSRLRERTASMPNVVLHNAAVGTEDATVRLYRREDFDERPDSASVSSSVFADKTNVEESQFVEVRQIDFPAFLAGLPGRIAILKIDIEGAEVPLLERMLADRSIDRCDAVFAETHEAKIPALAGRTATLREIAATGPFADKLFLEWD